MKMHAHFYYWPVFTLYNCLSCYCCCCCCFFRIGKMIDRLEYIWRRSLVTNCQLFIDKASEALPSALAAVKEEVRGDKAIM